MNDEIKIEKNVPIRRGRQGHPVLTKALRELKPGESFFVADGEYVGNIQGYVYNWARNKKMTGQFSVGRETKDGKSGYRIWRKKE